MLGPARRVSGGSQMENVGLRTVGFGNDLRDCIEILFPRHPVMFDLDEEQCDTTKASEEVLDPGT